MSVELISSLGRRAANLSASLDRWPVIGRVLTGVADLGEYLAFLECTYHYVKWSGQLLAATAEGVLQSGHYPSLGQLLAVKAVEESPHDRWLLEDIENCGANAEQARASAPSLSVDAYVAWGRALASTRSPGYVGAAYMLEGISSRRAGLAAKLLRQQNAIPGIEHAVRFLEGHGDADVGHIQTLEEALAAVHDSRHQAEILASADVLASLYPRFFKVSR